MTHTTGLFWATTLTMSLALLSGCRSSDHSAAASEEEGDAKPAVVQVVAPQQSIVGRTTTQPATVRAYYQAEVYAKVAGYLADLRVDIGDQVAGQTTLAVIAVPELQKQLDRQQAMVRSCQAEERRAQASITVAEASLSAASAAWKQAQAEAAEAKATLEANNSEFQRVSALVERQAVTNRLWDEAKMRFESSQAAQQAMEAAIVSADAKRNVAQAQVEAAHADLEAARAQTEVARQQYEELQAMFSYTSLSAPFPGVVVQRSVDPGDLVRNAQTGSRQDGPPLFVIAQLDKVRVRVAIPEREASLVDLGDQATIRLEALPGETFDGKVARISGFVDEGTRTMLVEIDLPNSEGKLRPGMFGQATITLEQPSSKVTLPAGAVRYDDQGNGFVYLVNGSEEVEIVPVQTGWDDGHRIEILAGLKGSESVVAATVGRLQPGQKVRPVGEPP